MVPLTRGYFAIISAVDAEAVGEFNWSVAPGRQTYYAARTGIRLHRFIGARMGLPPELEIDHRNTNGLDCRRLNLRAATAQQNKANMALSRANTTGAKGVSRLGDKFRARISAHGKVTDLGLFATVAEASAAAMEARERIHGEFANHGLERNGGKAIQRRVVERRDN